MFINLEDYEEPDVEIEDDPNFDSGDMIAKDVLEGNIGSLLVVQRSYLTPQTIDGDWLQKYILVNIYNPRQRVSFCYRC